MKMGAAGVCHSDWHLVTGATKHPMPVVAGHEGAGVVLAAGAGVEGICVGDPVVLNWTPDCGRCFYCLRGKANLCETYVGPIWAGTMLDGTPRLSWQGKPVYHFCGLASFATHAVVPQESCVVVRRDVPLEVAAVVGCAVATGVGAAMYTAGVKAGDSAVVFGCGGVGLCTLMGAKLCGAGIIIAVDQNERKMEMAREFGATHALLSGEDVVALEVKEITGGRGADHAPSFEAVGIPTGPERGAAGGLPARGQSDSGGAVGDGHGDEPAGRCFDPAGEDGQRLVLRLGPPPAGFSHAAGFVPVGKARSGSVDLQALLARADQ